MSKNNPETEKKWREKNKEKISKWHSEHYKKNKEILLEKHRARCKKSPRYSFNSILALAKKRAEVSIDTNYLMKLYDDQEGLCAISGTRMTWATGSLSPTSISVDRIDNSKGYFEGNVRLVCVCINAFKSTMNDEELLKISEAIVSNLKAKKVVQKYFEKEIV